MTLYPPADVEMQEYNNYFAKNYMLHNAEFSERTIKEIANISHLVSSVGNKWVYDIAAERGTFFHFDGYSIDLIPELFIVRTIILC